VQVGDLKPQPPRAALGACPMTRLNARLKDASDS
jgi:hypothetical protein